MHTPEQAPATGWLAHASGTFGMPIVHDLILGDQLDWPLPELIEPKARAIHETLRQRLPAYDEFVRRKGRRPVYDAYVCFQPFNEATRALLPFVHMLRRQLRPGDVILNLWDRSGWNTSWLAGLFPEQTILTVWDGDRDVLGYKGYAYWLTGTQAPANVQLLFQELNKPLPLNDHSVRLVIGMDVLHRFEQARVLRELMRVVAPDGGLLFPHVHLANNEPDPYFERGGRLLHGQQYMQFLEPLARQTNRQALVYSEPELFYFNEHSGSDTPAPKPNPATADYNGLVALLPDTWTEKQPMLEPYLAVEESTWASCRLLINFLLHINPLTGRVEYRAERFGGAVGHLLERHPVYQQHLASAHGYQLSAEARSVLYWAARQYTAIEIAQQLGRSVEELRPLLRELSALDIIQLVPVSAQSHRLQHFLAFQEFQAPRPEHTIPRLWARAQQHYGEATLLTALEDGSSFSYAEADAIVTDIRQALRRSRISAGDAVAIHAPLHAEVLLLSWACWLEGAVVVPLSMTLPAATAQTILESVSPKLLLVVAEKLADYEPIEVPKLVVDTDESSELPPNARWFSDWLSLEEEPETGEPTPPTITPTDVAAILFTSGSTGLPKGVPLTHGQLYRSARLVTETFGWETTDRFLAVGDADAMSGLRNAALAPLEVGASVIIPTVAQKQHASMLAEAVVTSQATLLAASPALLRQWVQLGRRIGTELRSLRLVMSTGSQLTPTLRTDFQQAFNLPIVNYYGLTETTGICLAERPEQAQPTADTIGWPVGCLAQIVDDQGQQVDPGQEGELRIYSDNLMQGPYYGPGSATPSPVREGWLYTGDIAVANPDGSVTLRGRRTELIKNALSEVVYPSEIETHLLAHAAVHQAAVCAFQRHDTERLAAFVTLGPGHDAALIVPQLLAHLTARVGEHKVPSVVQVLDALPYSSNGKVLKTQLLELLR
ncbi:AMP-binding protein [Hymenobacter sp. BT730]|uniref:AMP-binding protein n=1 Tax=Hymenobacter sp. BT730 TaxID=3063332 RepID=UPI0026E06DF0|nr:AMP-binding protein [Hymenobacter sp. BT730]